MARSRRSFRKAKAKVRVGLLSKKPRRIRAPPALLLPHSNQTLQWNDKETRLANYRALGLVANPNYHKGSSDTNDAGRSLDFAKAVEDQQMHEIEGSDMESEELRSALGKKRKDSRRSKLQRLTLMQRVYVGRLIQKYGDDFEGMARDIQLNKMQHSSSLLKLLCARFHAYDQSSNSTLSF